MKKFGEGQQPFYAIVDIPEGDAQELTTVTDQVLNSLYGEFFNLLKAHGINPTTTTSADLKQVARAVWSAVAAGNLYKDTGSSNVKNLIHIKTDGFLFKNTNANDDGFTIEFLNKTENTGAVTVNVFDVENNVNHFNNTPLVNQDGSEIRPKTLTANSMARAYYSKDTGKFILLSVQNTRVTDDYVYNIDGFALRDTVIQSVDSISSLAEITKTHGRKIFVVSYHAGLNKGGGTFVYDSTKANINDGGIIINGWVRLVSNNEINVLWCGAIGDGVADDTNAFNKAKNLACKIGGGVYVPQPVKEYILSSTINIDEKVYFRGDLGTMIDTWRGKTVQGGSRIKHIGTGVAFQINPLINPTSEQRPPYGCLFKDLVLESTENTTHGIKVSDKANIGVSGADIGSFNIDNVYLLNFKKGYGLQINYCFMNTITNLFTGDCAVAVSLNYAHNTTFIGGSIQQNLFGLDIINSYDVTFHGTCLQGNTVDRASLGLQMPSDFYVWPDGWSGQGADAIKRTTPQHYAGIGCRVFGSVVNWFGGYEEYNTVGYVTELDSTLNLHGKYVDLDAKTNYWVQIGIGALTIISPHFAQGDKPNLKGVIHTERNFAAPLNVISPIVPSTLPQNKLYTGRTAGGAGVYDAWNPTTFKFERNYLSSNINLNGQLTHKGLVATSGFNREFRETVLPASDTNKTLDLAVGTTGLNFVHLANGVTLTLDFNDANRAQAGSTMRVVVINNHATVDTVVTNSSNFRMGASNYTIPAQKQRVFEFYFENGVWLEKGVAVSL